MRFLSGFPRIADLKTLSVLPASLASAGQICNFHNYPLDGIYPTARLELARYWHGLILSCLKLRIDSHRAIIKGRVSKSNLARCEGILPRTDMSPGKIGRNYGGMKKIISICETLAVAKSAGHLKASADVFYDEEKGEMETTLKTDPGGNEELRAKGIDSEIVRTKISREEALPVAKDIFHSWIKRLLQSGLVALEK